MHTHNIIITIVFPPEIGYSSTHFDYAYCHIEVICMESVYAPQSSHSLVNAYWEYYNAIHV